MPFSLPELPYDYAALEPHISAETLRIHHGKHHQGYINAVNSLTDQLNPRYGTLEEIIADGPKNAAFNAAAQAWNHAFYWLSMMPGAGGTPTGKLARQIDSDFGNFIAFSDQLAAAAMGQFGSGWAWLVHHKGHLKIRRTPNAETPLSDGEAPLLTIDVWEHAYYVDYRNDRRAYVDAFLTSLANWDFAGRNLERATAGRKVDALAVWALS